MAARLVLCLLAAASAAASASSVAPPPPPAAAAAPPTRYAGRPQDLDVAQDEAVCALQHQQARVVAAPKPAVVVATPSVPALDSAVEAPAPRAAEQRDLVEAPVTAAVLSAEPSAALSAAIHDHAQALSQKANETGEHVGNASDYPAVGIATLNSGSGQFSDVLNAASVALDWLPNKQAFEDESGSTSLRLTIAFINDMFYPVFWKDFKMTDGHAYSAPKVGSMILPGEMFVVQAYARSDGLAGKVLLTDPVGNDLSAAFASYRVRNFFSGCDALKVRCMKTQDWDLPFDEMCSTREAGVFKRNDYEVLVSIGKSE
eukprot:CAMPEP_0203927980 /NCGR_PEP_ID=MMETSP0359-20131031/67321_1 /ASSEMBLY_ACC=CAM_ASM_000338 /TAXON_ID=268821 /ORGANISM="Scrippsiella Hangoei, Strain SHTV-5" /LENGTH=315 /DNA_ID=CAMNT_0050856839 /DNA_START=30 /DNA_END=977 /DNA_ORIENTATION=-